MKYLWIVLRHKWFVFLACFRMGVPVWRATVHDLSKLTLVEFPYYARWFGGNRQDPAGFAKAWLHHQNHNDHHPEYWITRADQSNCSVNGLLPMPEVCVDEMIADWMGASRVYTDSWDLYTWLVANLSRFRMHPDTQVIVARKLRELGYELQTDNISG